MAQKSRADIRRGIHSRIRKKVSGTSERPRLTVFRSRNHIYAQVIDDISGKTLASASTLEKSLKVKSGGNIEGALAVGETIAKRAMDAGIDHVVFDRGGFIYHGRVKALIESCREAGLNKDRERAGKSKASEKEESSEPKEDKNTAKTKKAVEAKPKKEEKTADAKAKKKKAGAKKEEEE